jgi:hypothetical protein
MAWAKNGTPNTLSTTTNTITISDLTAKKFNVFLSHTLQTAATAGLQGQFNNDSGSKYAIRRSVEGGADLTYTSSTAIYLSGGGGIVAENMFTIQYVCSISGEEKLGISFTVERKNTGSGNAPDRQETVFKYVPSPDADITRIDLEDADLPANPMASGANLTAIGTD